jgi:hypothetical protein
LDSGDMTTNESKELGEILHRLFPAVKSATGVQRVYYLALMERAAQGPPGCWPTGQQRRR